MSKPTPINKPLRLGLVGCGGIVRQNHAPSYLALRDRVQVVALADPVASNRDHLAEIFDVPSDAQYDDHMGLFTGGKVDAVTIATPHHVHVQQVIDAANAGLAIISEKPMATSLDEADRIMEAVAANNVPYAVVHNLLFSAPMKAALTELRESLGTPLFGRSQSLALKAENFATDTRNPGQLWRAKRSAGGGCLIDSAYHEIYAVEALVGSPVRWVQAKVKTAHFDIDVDDLAILLLEHENGCVSTVSSAWCTAVIDGGRWCEVHTSTGSIRVNHRAKDPVRVHTRKQGAWNSLPVPGWESTPDPAPFQVTGHFGFFEATINALLAGEKPPITGEDARHNLAIIEAARQASDERRAIEVKY